MPLKIQNYGEWKGDGPRGHHPPACTCYRCNEQRQAEEAGQEEERRAKEYDRRAAENQARSKGGKQQSSPSPKNPVNPAPKPSSRGRAPSRSQPQSTRSGQGNRTSRPSQSPQTGSQRRAAEAVRKSDLGARLAVHWRPSVASKAAEATEQSVQAVEGRHSFGTALRAWLTRGGGRGLGSVRLNPRGAFRCVANPGRRCSGLRPSLAYDGVVLRQA